MEPLLEQQRRLHEERERLLDAMVGEAILKKHSVKKTEPVDARTTLDFNDEENNDGKD